MFSGFYYFINRISYLFFYYNRSTSSHSFPSHNLYWNLPVWHLLINLGTCGVILKLRRRRRIPLGNLSKDIPCCLLEKFFIKRPTTVSNRGTDLRSVRGDSGEELIRSWNRIIWCLRVVFTKTGVERRGLGVCVCVCDSLYLFVFVLKTIKFYTGILLFHSREFVGHPFDSNDFLIFQTRSIVDFCPRNRVEDTFSSSDWDVISRSSVYVYRISVTTWGRKTKKF